ncbi:hypothetical protein A5893_16340 [Pedobacter psychrophilus]|uniref:TonB-dependent receptor n=1 Tax=Pedobacter psychrophilus TaxID=1826909 RepID=A0A179DBP2_9SPHI|nr:hypothetical protein [Pedobacter psychrophilus]OAQ37939.1 hypothetical protein A5893_16340 [Pedobacter psychrophilus]
MKQIICALIFLIFSFAAYSQTTAQVGGIVFDLDTRFRINRVVITNLNTNESVFNNTKGEFFIKAKVGDILISKLQGYKSDTLKFAGQTSLIIYLKRLSIPLPEVVFKDSVLSAKAKYEETKKSFNKAVRLGNNKDLISVGPSGAGLSIESIWSSFSREGKNARKLMEIMERDYQNSLIDQIFNKELVKRVTGLKGDKLLIFMINYRPSYSFAVKAKDYDLVSYIKITYMRFQMNPNLQDISDLRLIEIR